MNRSHLFLGAGVLTALVGLETDAFACGGCFSPPETPTATTGARTSWLAVALAFAGIALGRSLRRRGAKG